MSTNGGVGEFLVPMKHPHPHPSGSGRNSCIYYGIALYSCWRFFRRPERQFDAGFTPPISNLKPVRGLDPDAYENFASFCRQDYPEYELIFCVGDREDPAIPMIDG